MKKLLIASTALVATSGFAYADVTLGGSAQFGVIYQEDRADPTDSSDDEELFLDYELQFDFSASGETDGGLGFGMSAELESDSNATADSNEQGFDPEIFITGAYGTLSVGDVDIATDGFGSTRDPGYDGIGIDNAIDVIITLGLDDFDPLDGDAPADAPDTIRGSDTNVRYDGTFGGLTLIATADSHDEDYAAVLSYDFGSFSAGLGYASADLGATGDAESISATVGGSFAGFDIDFVYVTHENDLFDAEGYGLSGDYDLGMYTITFAVNQVEADNDSVDVSGTSYGVGVAYDLGGGASLSAGIGSEYDLLSDDDRTVASFGINMSF